VTRISELTYREKSLYWNLAPNVLIFAVLVATLLFTAFDPHRHPAAVFACVALFYFGDFGQMIYMMYFAADTRTDERDRTMELRATRSGYAVLSGGIFFLILLGANMDIGSSPRFILWLFVLWILSRIVRDASELRLHGGHEGLWPDFIIHRLRNRDPLDRLRRMDPEKLARIANRRAFRIKK
jgi:hypothetical protein